MGMHLMLEIGTRSAMATCAGLHGVEPGEGPRRFWKPFLQRPVHLVASLVVPALFAYVFGFLNFRSRSAASTSRSSNAGARALHVASCSTERDEPGRHQRPDGFKSVFGFTLKARHPRGSTSSPRSVSAGLSPVRWIHLLAGRAGADRIRDSENGCSLRLLAAAFKLFGSWSPRCWRAWRARSRPRSDITPAKIGVLPSIEMIIGWRGRAGHAARSGGGRAGVNWLQSLLTDALSRSLAARLRGLFVGVVLFFPTEWWAPAEADHPTRPPAG